MTVSVAMATYNGMAYLERQIDSILPQLGEEDELVVSDDGSTDGTMTYLCQLAAEDARVRVLNGPKNGVMDNFECAIAACRGDWIFLCDQDDEWDADKCRTVLETAQSTGATLIMHDARVIDAQGHVAEPSVFAARRVKTGVLTNLWRNRYMGCSMAFSRRLLPYVLPFERPIPMHDQWIGLQAERHGTVVLIHRPLMSYRRHDANVSPTTHGLMGTMLRHRVHMLTALWRRR